MFLFLCPCVPNTFATCGTVVVFRVCLFEFKQMINSLRSSSSYRFLPFVALVVVNLILGFLLYQTDARSVLVCFLVSAWVLSLCIHEFGHAWVAYHGGDGSVKDKGYLDLNPLKYTSLC